ncbi:hypothetical protein ACHWQZ_G015078 [Mnemiopsis leidyi]
MILYLIILILTIVSPLISSHHQSPNIIFIFADDLGNADVGYMGSEILTPNIDTLAHSGVILNQHYVQPQCSPSRAAFVTGRYPIHTGFHDGNIMQGELWGLGLEEFLIGEMFQEYGYKTHAVGKWHLGWRTWRHTPIHRGFDSFFGFYFCAHDHYDYTCGLRSGNKTSSENRTERRMRKYNKKLVKQGLSIRQPIPDNYFKSTKDQDKAGQKYFDLRENYFDEKHRLVDKMRHDLKGQYSANVFTDAAIDKIKNRGEDPFFMYLSYMNVHSPYQAPDHYLDRYTSHMKANKDRKSYAAMMSSMDEGIGNITKTLIAEGIYNNTILVFASDNGANVGYCKDTEDVEGGVVFNKRNKQRIEPGSNYPLRGGKRSIFEGGIRSVAFVHSPLLQVQGRTSNDLIHVVDWFSTFEDIISDGFTKPPLYHIKNRPPSDSISAWRAISQGLPGKRKKFLININTKGGIKCGPNAPFKGIRKNQWKLIVGGGGPPAGWYNPYSAPIPSPGMKYIELYNIEIDPSETLNLAPSNPAIVLDLLRELKLYKETMVPSIRRKKIDLTPYLQNMTPTPIDVTDPRNSESFFVGVQDKDDLNDISFDFEYSEVTEA